LLNLLNIYSEELLAYMMWIVVVYDVIVYELKSIENCHNEIYFSQNLKEVTVLFWQKVSITSND